jgi:hypothetical protein
VAQDVIAFCDGGRNGDGSGGVVLDHHVASPLSRGGGPIDYAGGIDFEE